MTLKDFKIGCEQFTRDELIESLYNITKENERLNKQYDLMENSLDEKQEVIDKAIEYIKNNCILSNEWTETEWGSLNFIPTGKITYKPLSKNKVKELLNILKGDE